MSYPLGIVILHVKDLAKSQAFYTERLGLALVPEQSSPTFVMLAATSTTCIGLEDSSANSAAGRPAAFELGFAVDDVDGLYRDWLKAGVTIVKEPADFPFGRAFDALDPDGVSLSLYQMRQPT